MRQIKFRAWDKSKNKWARDIIMNLHGAVFEFIYGEEAGDGDYKEASNIILLQFTGLLDKNGKEIYEEDIIKHPVCEIGKVIFFQAYAGFYVESRGLLYDLNVNNECEVIGNSMENPELLNQ